ncbi:unnamed protein product [Paramecium pentaurelia]|uniref:Helicase C-terminal domain-containing protein n=1 Tax=Paramecium pentaurelia TaxID=43138 RepID=A0A8S1XJ25_9CILI|nr:unnamed protein product [Paramecium pentaurelia]
MTLEGIKQFFIQIDEEEWKFETLCDIYNAFNVTQSVIFCSTKYKCYKYMIENRFSVIQMHQNISKQERGKIMADFRFGNYRVLITSDIFGSSIFLLSLQGFDIELISLIINYYITKLKDYIFTEFGRTNKFGRKSIAIFFYFKKIKKFI